MMRKAILLLLAMSACMTGEAPGDEPAGDPADYEEVNWTGQDGKGDFTGVPAAFDRNLIMSDVVLRASLAVDGNGVQELLENTPYGTRSWLADYKIDNKRFADVLVEESRAGGINPVVLLARMQVESSLVSKTVKPGTTTINHALGCGCPDGAACGRAYAGMKTQIDCAIEVINNMFSLSEDGTGQWRRAHARKTLDPITVTPSTHATAALYAYTPWVLVGRGGNWLVWNVTRKYLKHFDEAGTLTLP